MATEEEVLSVLTERTNSGALKWEGNPESLVAKVQAGTFILTMRDTSNPARQVARLAYKPNEAQAAETLSTGENAETLRRVVLQAQRRALLDSAFDALAGESDFSSGAP